jgi:hypothetical protein
MAKMIFTIRYLSRLYVELSGFFKIFILAYPFIHFGRGLMNAGSYRLKSIREPGWKVMEEEEMSKQQLVGAF